MAIAVFPKRSLHKPPNSLVAINRGHPLAYGMVGCFMLNEYGGVSVREQMTGARVGTWSPVNDVGWGASTAGVGVRYSGANHTKITVPELTYLRQPLPMSMVALVMPTALGANRGIMANDDGIVYQGVSMFVFSTGAIQINFGDATGTAGTDRRSGFTGASRCPVNKVTHIVGVIRGAADMDIYVDGIRDTLNYDGTGGAMAYGASPASIGRWHTITAGWIGHIYQAMFYNRIITPTEAQWLFQEPYAFLKPQPTRVSYSISAIPSTSRRPLIFVVN